MKSEKTNYKGVDRGKIGVKLDKRLLGISIILGIVGVGLYVSTSGEEEIPREEGIPSEEEQTAISMVQNYGKNIGGEETLLSVLSMTLEITEDFGTPIDIQGWYADHVSGDIYQVGFAFKEWGEQKIIEWRVDISTGSVISLDETAANIQGTAELS